MHHDHARSRLYPAVMRLLRAVSIALLVVGVLFGLDRAYADTPATWSGKVFWDNHGLVCPKDTQAPVYGVEFWGKGSKYGYGICWNHAANWKNGDIFIWSFKTTKQRNHFLHDIKTDWWIPKHKHWYVVKKRAVLYSGVLNAKSQANWIKTRSGGLIRCFGTPCP